MSWRLLAWTPEGAPIKGFVLQVDAIFEAERQLVARPQLDEDPFTIK